MPAASKTTSPYERQLLIQLGDRLRRVRQDQKITAVALAKRVGISRMTLGAVEAGEPAPTIGTYLRVMSGLGIAGDLALVASGELKSQPSATASPVVLRTKTARHEVQDLQSLLLHEEAVRQMKARPELIGKALETLETWRATGNVNTRVLWDEWSVLLRRRDWRRVLAPSRRSAELRQASPVTVLLDQETRERVLEEVHRLRQGVTLGHIEDASPVPARAKGSH